MSEVVPVLLVLVVLVVIYFFAFREFKQKFSNLSHKDRQKVADLRKQFLLIRIGFILVFLIISLLVVALKNI